jgi:hypothetical protein
MSRGDFKTVVPPLGHICAERVVYVFPADLASAPGGFVVAVCNRKPGDRLPFDTLIEARRFAEGLSEGLGCEIRDHTKDFTA